LQQKIEVCGQQLVSSGGGQQIAALQIVSHYFRQLSLTGIDGNRTRGLSHSWIRNLRRM
jgi:hypothetical protein